MQARTIRLIVYSPMFRETSQCHNINIFSLTILYVRTGGIGAIGGIGPCCIGGWFGNGGPGHK